MFLLNEHSQTLGILFITSVNPEIVMGAIAPPPTILKLILKILDKHFFTNDIILLKNILKIKLRYNFVSSGEIARSTLDRFQRVWNSKIQNINSIASNFPIDNNCQMVTKYVGETAERITGVILFVLHKTYDFIYT